MLTLKELRVVMPLLEVAIKVTGLQVFQQGGGVEMQSAHDKLQARVNELEAEEKEKANGKH